MISQVLLFVLMAAPASGGTGGARQAYAKCVRMMMVTDLKAKTAADAFQAKLATACQAELSTFKTISVNADVAAGIRRASAEQNANDDAADMVSSAADRYKEYLETNTLPQHE